MIGRDTVSLLRFRPSQVGRRLVLVLLSVGCALLVVRTQVQLETRPTFVGPAGGLHLGRPIPDLWDDQRPSQAWFSDPRCRQLVTRFTRDDCLPLVYLASFPRSGNTWMRYLLEASSGLFTSSGGPNYWQYKNYSTSEFKLSNAAIERAAAPERGQLVALGYRGEYIRWTQGITIVAKTHERPVPWNITESESELKFWVPFPKGDVRRAVLIVRDPFKSFISLEKYSQTKSVLNDADMAERFRSDAWRQFVLDYAQIWHDMNAKWVEETNVTHVIAYERLTADPIGELTRLLHFLDIEPDPQRLECLRRHLEGKVHNHHHGVVPDHETYPLRQRAEVWSRIHQLNWLLKDRGYPTLPLERYSFAEEFGDVGVGV